MPDTSGWDRPLRDNSKIVHWYVGPRPMCGTDAGLSLVTSRTKELPNIKGTGLKICKRCLKKTGVPVLQRVR